MSVSYHAKAKVKAKGPTLPELRRCWLTWTHIVKIASKGGPPPDPAAFAAFRTRLAEAIGAARKSSPQLSGALDEAEMLADPWREPHMLRRADRVSLQILHAQCLTAGRGFGCSTGRVWTSAALMLIVLLLGLGAPIVFRATSTHVNPPAWIANLCRFVDNAGIAGKSAILAIGVTLIGIILLDRTTSS